MTMPEHGLALSDAAIDYFQWLDGDGHAKPYLDPSSANPVILPPIGNQWYSIAKDVRGMPDITIQISADTLPAENIYPFDIETSLDGKHWNKIPPAFIVVDPPGPLAIQNVVVILLLLYLRTNYLRMVPYSTAGGPYSSGQIVAAIVRGEV